MIINCIKKYTGRERNSVIRSWENKIQERNYSIKRKMIKRLAKEIKEYKKTSILTPIFMIGEVLMEILLPFLMAYIIDDGVNKGDIKAVCFYGILMVISAFVSLACGTIAGKTSAHASAGFAKNLRKAMFENIQTFSFANIDKFSTAGLVTRMTTDVTNVQNSYQMILKSCFRAPLLLICAWCMTFWISPSLSMIDVVAVILLAIILYVIATRAHDIFQQVFDRYDNLNASVQENIMNIRVVKAYVKENQETEKFKKASYYLYYLFKKAESLLVFNSPAMQLVMYTCLIMISWIGANMIVSETLTTGQLMSLFTYTTSILSSLMMISMIFVMLTMSVASGERIVEVLNEVSTIQNPQNPRYEIDNGAISFEDVCFGYASDEKNYNLQHININIQSGETIGIIGGTGSAKTTLVQLIARLYDVQEGIVKVGGYDVREYDLDTLRNAVSMVLQKNVLFSGTIKDNLRWGNEHATDEQMQHACQLAQADSFIQTFPKGYDTYIEQGGSNVSGGQKQRLCIARALLKDPKVLILDDSTSAVDTKTDYLIRQAFLNEIPDMTKIIIAQRISSVQDADRIIVLDDGKISGIGTHEQLLKENAIYQEVYATQVKGDDNNG